MSIRETLLERARAELSSLDPGDPEDRPHHEQLSELVEHLTEGVLSPLVLEKVAESRGTPRRAGIWR